MTDKEKAIVMAYTGICMLTGEKFRVFHKYIEDIMGRPVFTHELAIKSISDEIKEKSRDDFMRLCTETSEQEPFCRGHENGELQPVGNSDRFRLRGEQMAELNLNVEKMAQSCVDRLVQAESEEI